MKDVTGKEIKVGDKVVTNWVGYSYKLKVSTVIGLTDQKVKLSGSARFAGLYDKTATCLKFPEQVAVVG